ncbi:M18 family aminopeptidase [Candidatus Njordibacter sp. Uisw_039]|jgi:aspartyl aminopeptidase|uniref:M18 family aminopeptidase n=1 Tax=Candidatus Njordibacter sp. Uisw_039 TaxID=3230972 RepID=UPI003A432F07|tara:strand:+ start:2963 stop:4249 length:1287 start_codon:yes stop_codon:yes gene_type:complete
MPQRTYLDGLMSFISDSPTPFHAVASMVSQFRAAGYSQLDVSDTWQLEAGGRYFITRNDSTILAFQLPQKNALQRLHMVGAHTDSPCLKVKPNPEIRRKGYQQLGVEVYGGALLHPWFDRDLSLAGRVVSRDVKGQLVRHLLDFKRPVACIPSLAIHLDREANKDHSVNPQTDLPVLLGQSLGDDFSLRSLLADELKANGHKVNQVIDYELSFYDFQAPALVGIKQEFLAAARLDNLLSCYIGLTAMIGAQTDQGMLLICNDHEEVGSQSAEGAQGSFLMSVLQRIYPTAELLHQVLNASTFISADNAHGVHPNFTNKHDNQHGPKLNQGPVIKVNANQRYATNAVTSAMVKELAAQVDLPIQTFVVRSDMGCGSTIGPITAAQLGVRTLDLGVPTFAMHSIRELAGSDDAQTTHKLLQKFFETEMTV